MDAVPTIISTFQFVGAHRWCAPTFIRKIRRGGHKNPPRMALGQT